MRALILLALLPLASLAQTVDSSTITADRDDAALAIYVKAQQDKSARLHEEARHQKPLPTRKHHRCRRKHR